MSLHSGDFDRDPSGDPVPRCFRTMESDDDCGWDDIDLPESGLLGEDHILPLDAAPASTSARAAPRTALDAALSDGEPAASANPLQQRPARHPIAANGALGMSYGLPAFASASGNAAPNAVANAAAASMGSARGSTASLARSGSYESAGTLTHAGLSASSSGRFQDAIDDDGLDGFSHASDEETTSQAAAAAAAARDRMAHAFQRGAVEPLVWRASGQDFLPLADRADLQPAAGAAASPATAAAVQPSQPSASGAPRAALLRQASDVFRDPLDGGDGDGDGDDDVDDWRAALARGPAHRRKPPAGRRDLPAAPLPAPLATATAAAMSTPASTSTPVAAPADSRNPAPPTAASKKPTSRGGFIPFAAFQQQAPPPPSASPRSTTAAAATQRSVSPAPARASKSPAPVAPMLSRQSSALGFSGHFSESDMDMAFDDDDGGAPPAAAAARGAAPSPGKRAPATRGFIPFVPPGGAAPHIAGSAVPSASSSPSPSPGPASRATLLSRSSSLFDDDAAAQRLGEDADADPFADMSDDDGDARGDEADDDRSSALPAARPARPAPVRHAVVARPSAARSDAATTGAAHLLTPPARPAATATPTATANENATPRTVTKAMAAPLADDDDLDGLDVPDVALHLVDNPLQRHLAAYVTPSSSDLDLSVGMPSDPLGGSAQSSPLRDLSTARFARREGSLRAHDTDEETDDWADPARADGGGGGSGANAAGKRYRASPTPSSTASLIHSESEEDTFDDVAFPSVMQTLPLRLKQTAARVAAESDALAHGSLLSSRTTFRSSSGDGLLGHASGEFSVGADDDEGGLLDGLDLPDDSSRLASHFTASAFLSASTGRLPVGRPHTAPQRPSAAASPSSDATSPGGPASPLAALRREGAGDAPRPHHAGSIGNMLVSIPPGITDMKAAASLLAVAAPRAQGTTFLRTPKSLSAAGLASDPRAALPFGDGTELDDLDDLDETVAPPARDATARPSGPAAAGGRSGPPPGAAAPRPRLAHAAASAQVGKLGSGPGSSAGSPSTGFLASKLGMGSGSSGGGGGGGGGSAAAGTTAPHAYGGLLSRHNASTMPGGANAAPSPSLDKKKRRPRKKPTLIKNLNAANLKQPRVVGAMKYNPESQTWEGNDEALLAFDRVIGTAPAVRPALIKNVGGGKAALQVGQMVFDPVSMCWIGNDDEKDIFAEMEDLVADSPSAEAQDSLNSAFELLANERETLYVSEAAHKLFIGRWCPSILNDGRHSGSSAAAAGLGSGSGLARDTSRGHLYDIRSL